MNTEKPQIIGSYIDLYMAFMKIISNQNAVYITPSDIRPPTQSSSIRTCIVIGVYTQPEHAGLILKIQYFWI